MKLSSIDVKCLVILNHFFCWRKSDETNQHVQTRMYLVENHRKNRCTLVEDVGKEEEKKNPSSFFLSAYLLFSLLI